MTNRQDRIHQFAIPTPYPVGPINVYLIEGDPLTLIDAGPRTESAYQALVKGLADLGYRPSDIEQIVVTHSHADHIGQLSKLVESSDAQVLSHHAEYYWLVDFEGEWKRQAAFYGAFLRQAGLPAEQLAMMAQAVSMGAYLGASIPETRLHLLEDGDRIEAGNAEWHVFHMPGHASGHVVLYQPEAGIIIAGDLLLAHISSNPVLEAPARGQSERPHSLVQYLNSLQRLAQLEASRTLPGHGPTIENHRELVTERLAFHQRRLERVIEVLANGRQDAERASTGSGQPDEGRTPYQVCQALFPDLPPQDIFLGISEVMGHLDILEGEGRVVAETRNGQLRYRIAQALPGPTAGPLDQAHAGQHDQNPDRLTQG